MSQNIDERVLHDVYDSESASLESIMRFSDVTSIPGFALIPLSTALATELGNPPSRQDAYLMILSEGVSGVIMLGLKKVLARDRPYLSVEGIEFRRGEKSPSANNSYSLPSGHATMAFSLATSLSIHYPKWYVIVPSYAWAAGVATSRLYYGMHFPSDVVAGAVLGTVVTFVIHRLGTRITPKFLREEDSSRLSLSPAGVSFTLKW